MTRHTLVRQTAGAILRTIPALAGRRCHAARGLVAPVVALRVCWLARFAVRL